MSSVMIPSGHPLLATALACVAVFALWKVFRSVYHSYTSPLRHLRGPKGTSWILGNLAEMIATEDSVLLEGWMKQYGTTLTYKGLFRTNRLLTMDTRAINHILTHSVDYHKPPQVRYNLSQILGSGVLIVEGAQHRQQRRIMNPAFGPTQIRALTQIFHAKATRLRDVWLSEIAKDAAGTTTSIRLDVMPWLSRATLDVIGLAGFNYNFDALNANEKPNKLSEAFATVIAASEGLTFLSILQSQFPPFRLLRSDRARKIQIARRTMEHIGRELLSDAKAVAQTNATEKGEIGKESLGGRDLLSLLVKANMATDIPESQRLSDEDVLAQVPTFLFAGHETTSTAVTWALYAMANEPASQNKLREELLSVDSETPSMDELMELPYLDAIVKETLRLHSPVPGTLRIAMRDDVVPVERPFTDKYGIVRDSINVRQGDSILIPILALNHSQELWGPDAHEFKPERWQNVPEAVSQIPGVWGHQLTFLGGPRACIGYRFSVVEMKALLFNLVRTFEFRPAVPASEIGKVVTIVNRPVLRSDSTKRPQLPLLLRPYQPANVKCGGFSI